MLTTLDFADELNKSIKKARRWDGLKYNTMRPTA
jgi:hypothetical protein